MRFAFWLSFGVGVGLMGCGQIGTADKAPFVDLIAPEDLDSSYVPADAFFEFVNQRWINQHPIPDSKSSWGAFHELQEKSREEVHQLMVEAAEAGPQADANTRLMGKFWTAAMDTVAIDKAGMSALMRLTSGWTYGQDPSTRALHFAKALPHGIPLPFSIYVDQDLKDHTRNVLYLGQDGLGLPERDYYFRKDERSVALRKSYEDMILRFFELRGQSTDEAQKNATRVLALETYLAKHSMTLEAMRDPYATYHPAHLEDLMQWMPGFDWHLFLEQIGIETSDLIVGQPDYFKALEKAFTLFDEPHWAAYFQFHETRFGAPFMHQALADAHFQFYGKTLMGKKTPEPRWQRVCEQADVWLRDAIGQAYVKKVFDETAKTKVLSLVENLRKAFDKRIEKLVWMSDTTKLAAREKLAKIQVKMGYPDIWRSYEGLQLEHPLYVLNIAEATAFENRRMWKKLHQPVDRREWYMGPQTVNAYYNPTFNEIVFPAAILQPPFFHPQADPAVNYGGIGMVIGHELTHGFDDQGRQFDALGNLKDWWEEEDAEKFKSLAQRFVAFYNAYRPVDTLAINGQLTLGENIADLGGLWIAWDAYQSLPESERSAPIGGLHPDERFFINFAQIWRGHDRTESLIQRLYTDVHSPRKYRVIGVLSNFPPFYKVFGVKEGHQLFVKEMDQCKLW